MMSGNTNVADLTGGFGFNECFQRSAGSCDLSQILLCAHIMNLPQIQIIGMQSVKGLFKIIQRVGFVPAGGFTGLKNLGAHFWMLLPDISVIQFAVGINAGRIKIINPLIDGLRNNL